MTDEFYLIAITALLPLTAVMLVLQVNPYQALVMRGILGAIAALVYALFGAADVALTEALVGTMLSITLYAVAVRSSMEMRLGWVPPVGAETSQDITQKATQATIAETEVEPVASPNVEDEPPPPATPDEALMVALRAALKPQHLRLEVVAYPSLDALATALNDKQIHSAVLPANVNRSTDQASQATGAYAIQTRVQRLYQILGDRLPSQYATVDYWEVTQSSPPQLSSPSAPSSLVRPAQESS